MFFRAKMNDPLSQIGFEHLKILQIDVDFCFREFVQRLFDKRDRSPRQEACALSAAASCSAESSA